MSRLGVVANTVFAIGILALPVHAAPIHDAAKSDDVQAIAVELDRGESVDLTDGSATPLYYAVTKGKLNAVKLLIDRGADVNLSTKWGPPIINAAWNGDEEILKLLLGAGANPNSSFNTDSALHMAAERGRLGAVKLLVAAGADVNALNKFREPPIHFAMRKGHGDVAAYFTANGYVTPAPGPISSFLGDADAARGKTLFVRECSRCHDSGPENRKFRGPPLWNIVGRAKATIQDFKYSPALIERGGSWDYEDLNQYLSDPTRVLPGTDMGSNGLQDVGDRADLIAFLRTRSDAPPPLPAK